jgi:ATP-dependent helicase IRC3
MLQDRPYQSDAIEADIAAYDAGVRRMMNVMATGTGKTVVFAKLFEKLKSRLPGQMMVVAHTEELVNQNQTKITEVNPTLKVGKEMAGTYADIDSDIISASVATLGRANSDRAKRFNWDRIDKVIIDEAHHSVTDAYGRVLSLSGSLSQGTDKFLLGVTATSQRPDGRALSDIYEKVAFVYSLRQAIADKWLVPIRGYRVTTDTSLDEVERSGGDYRVSALSSAVDTPSRNRRIVTAWKTLAASRRTMAFTADIEHAKHLAEAFREAGITAEYIYGDDPERAEKIDRHRRGITTVLCNCSVLVEGYDDPEISCVVLARPTTSSILLSQMVGRGTRLDPRVAWDRAQEARGVVYQNAVSWDIKGPIKEDLIVIDVVDATVSASLVTFPTLMGLSNLIDLKGRGLLEVVEEIEAAQEAHPSIDFATINDANDIASVIQAINMFEVRFPEEVEKNSELIWFKAIGGGYKISIPKDGPERAGYLHIYENQLGQWVIEGRIKDADLLGTRGTIEEAFKCGDEQIRKRLGTMRLSYLLREATWHGKPVSPGQIKMLERLFPKRLFPIAQMTMGMASKVIAERLNRK